MKNINLSKDSFLKRGFLLLLVFAMLLAVSCSNTTTDPTNNEEPQNQTSTDAPVDEVIRPDHEINPTPDPLSVDQAALSLDGYGALGALADEDLTLIDMLTYAVQDEYLAHGEYVAIMDKFGNQNPYANIKRSEEMHLSFLQEVYDSYGLAFPEDTSSDHSIIPEDLLQAAQTGVQAEIDNIAMYERFLEYELPENIEQVFIALKNGSESHLLAFQKQVDRLS
ncbi:DUF2202 domain-containing protein [Alkalibacter rhizosphaerae]|uniref:DUF2202 domain-containing protein n=1 Tax=Alkalibacter rhizosphaerae TaxID=2815577 RepID=A0A974XES0_9FIRM|nr:DUF2202 domain-containing protein [Alkalibacter rhizosphaerae]QSX08519.1 DUF2202 domain-containing protein [Alkalibacter rhizosphaerae]